MNQDNNTIRDARNTNRSPRGHSNRRGAKPVQNGTTDRLSKRGGNSSTAKNSPPRSLAVNHAQRRMLPYNGEQAIVTVERLLGEPTDAAICNLRGFIGKLSVRDIDGGSSEAHAWLASVTSGDELHFLEVFDVRQQSGHLRFRLRPPGDSIEVKKPTTEPVAPAVPTPPMASPAQPPRVLTEAEKLEAMKRKLSVRAVVAAVGASGLVVQIGSYTAVLAANQLEGHNRKERAARKDAIKKGDVLQVALTTVVPNGVTGGFDIRCSERAVALGRFLEGARGQTGVVGKVQQVTLEGVWMRLAGSYFGFAKHSDLGLGAKPGDRVQVKVTGLVKTGRPHLTLVRKGSSGRSA